MVLLLAILSPNSIIIISQIITILLALAYKNCKNHSIKEIYNKNLIYFIPCYNESKTDLLGNITSFIEQYNIKSHKILLVIMCDGMGNIGKNNKMATNDILANDIFKNYITKTYIINNAYKTWHDEYNSLNIYTGIYKGQDFMIINKHDNIGKKDSLFLLRSLLYKFNNQEIINESLSEKLTDTITNIFIGFKFYNFDAIISTDADTTINKKCIYYLVNELYNYHDNVVGIAGVVKVAPEISIWNFWNIYQFCNYLNGQLINRLHQSLITSRVSCLPGCLQILKINEVSCGLEIMKEFNYNPKDTNNILKYLRYNLGEDVAHTMIMHKLFHNRSLTKQSLLAEAYTQIPLDLKTFLCQRRRWMIGGFINEVQMLNINYNIYESCIMFIFTITFLTIPFISYTYSLIIYELVTAGQTSSMIMNTIISLGIIFLVPKIYLGCAPLMVNMTNKEKINYYIGLIFYNIIEYILNLFVYIYSFYNLDDISWGKTRENKKEMPLEHDYVYIQTPINKSVV